MGTKKRRKDAMTKQAIVLQVLLDRKPRFGLEIAEAAKERTGGRVVIRTGSLYPTLWALEEGGLVRAFDGEAVPARRGKPRRYYEITGKGLRVARGDREAVAGLLGLMVGEGVA